MRTFLGREVRVGDRVIARTGCCGTCYECRVAHQPRRCRNLQVRYGFSRAQDAPLSGGYGQYLYLSSPQTTFMLKLDARPSIAALGSVLEVEMTARLEYLTYVKTRACWLLSATYLHI